MNLATKDSKTIKAIAFPAMVSTRVAGAALSPILFAHAPALLIVMSPFLVHLVVVAPIVTAAVYFPLALVVTTIQALIGYFFGSTYGPKAVEWLVERTPISLTRANTLLDLVRRASILAIFAIPGPILGTIAGAAGVRRKVFLLLVAPAQALWVTAAYFVGEALLEYIEIGRTFVIDHAFSLTALTASLVAIRWFLGRRSKQKKQS